MTVEARCGVVCGECGSWFTLTARNARRWRTLGQDPLCHVCRYPGAGSVDPAAVERLQRWWLNRYTLDELRELGNMLGWR